MIRIQISPEASRDLLHIAEFLEGASGTSYLGDRFLATAASTLKVLETFPLAGRERSFRSERLLGVRSLVIDSPFDQYIVFYQCLTKVTLILRVLHGAQDLDKIFT